MNNENDEKYKEFPHSVIVKTTAKGLAYWDIKVRFVEYYTEVAEYIRDIHNKLLEQYKDMNVYENNGGS